MKSLTTGTQRKTDLVINFHITESCNYKCSYCYATWDDLEAKNELHRSPNKVASLLKNLASYFLSDNSLKAKMGYENVRLNFAGGEPMLLGKRFIDAIKFANQLGFKTSLITNGHYLSNDILDDIGPSLDVLGISYDSANYDIAQKIGRVDRNNRWISADDLRMICARYRALNSTGVLKLNTVVNAVNKDDSLLPLMTRIKPDKWKLLRVLPVYNHDLVISQSEYLAYVNRHQALANIIVEEDNDAMTHTYLMVNPEGRFYQNAEAGSGYVLSDLILAVGVEKALTQIPFDVSGFQQRYQLIPAVELSGEVTLLVKECDPIPDNLFSKIQDRIIDFQQSREQFSYWFKMKNGESIYYCRLNDNYRMVVEVKNKNTGPYECMKHSTFDNRF